MKIENHFRGNFNGSVSIPQAVGTIAIAVMNI